MLFILLLELVKVYARMPTFCRRHAAHALIFRPSGGGAPLFKILAAEKTREVSDAVSGVLDTTGAAELA